MKRGLDIYGTAEHGAWSVHGSKEAGKVGAYCKVELHNI